MKIGTVLYECNVEEPSGKITWDEWRVRTVRGGKVYAILKVSCTWGKLSRKNGDFGWLDPIPSFARRFKRIGEDWPSWWSMSTTKKAAIKRAINSMRFAEDDDYTGITVAEIVQKLKTMYKRQK